MDESQDNYLSDDGLQSNNSNNNSNNDELRNSGSDNDELSSSSSNDDDDELSGSSSNEDGDELQYLYMQEMVQEYDNYANVSSDDLYESSLSDPLSENINNSKF
jgi:hypothetical protein